MTNDLIVREFAGQSRLLYECPHTIGESPYIQTWHVVISNLTWACIFPFELFLPSGGKTRVVLETKKLQESGSQK